MNHQKTEQLETKFLKFFNALTDFWKKLQLEIKTTEFICLAGSISSSNTQTKSTDHMFKNALFAYYKIILSPLKPRLTKIKSTN